MRASGSGGRPHWRACAPLSTPGMTRAFTPPGSRPRSYALESLGESDDPSRATPGALRPLQDVLGGILDRSALRAALAKRLREPAEVGTVRTLPALMADLEAERSELLQRFRAHGAELLRSVEAPP